MSCDSDGVALIKKLEVYDYFRDLFEVIMYFTVFYGSCSKSCQNKIIR